MGECNIPFHFYLFSVLDNFRCQIHQRRDGRDIPSFFVRILIPLSIFLSNSSLFLRRVLASAASRSPRDPAEIGRAARTTEMATFVSDNEGGAGRHFIGLTDIFKQPSIYPPRPAPRPSQTLDYTCFSGKPLLWGTWLKIVRMMLFVRTRVSTGQTNKFLLITRTKENRILNNKHPLSFNSLFI